MVCTFSGTTITVGSDTEITSLATSTGYVASVVKLSNSSVFIAHLYNGDYQYLYGIVCSINGTTITHGIDTALVTSAYYAGTAISTCLLPDGNIFIAHSYGSGFPLYGIIVTVSGTSITKNTDTQLSSESLSGRVLSTVLLSNGNVFIAHSQTSGSYHLYAQIFGIDEANNIPTNNVVITEYEQQVTLATEPPFNGIALSDGVGGTATAHNQQVKIARPKPISLIVNGDFSNGTNNWVILQGSYPCTYEVIDNELIYTAQGDGSGANIGIYQTVPTIPIGHTFYASLYVRGQVSDNSSIRILAQYNQSSAKALWLTINSEKTKVSYRDTMTDYELTTFKINPQKAVTGDMIAVSNIKLYDLTAVFGEGNEPTQEWCDENL